MKPEAQAKASALSSADEYLGLGVPAEWVEPLQKLGYTTVEKLKELENPGNLVNDLNCYKKSSLYQSIGAFLSPGCHSIYLFDLYPPFSYLS